MAFYSVTHKHLIFKLSEIGMREMLLIWIADFITGRSQTMCIDVSKLKTTPVLIGVSQGSVLGLLLFLVCINDCVDNLGFSAVMFSNYVKVWLPIISDSDRHIIQESFNRLLGGC